MPTAKLELFDQDLQNVTSIYKPVDYPGRMAILICLVERSEKHILHLKCC